MFLGQYLENDRSEDAIITHFLNLESGDIPIEEVFR